MELDERADLVGDVIGERVDPVADAGDPGNTNRDERGDLVRFVGHRDTDHDIDVEAGEDRGPEVGGDRDAQRRPPLRHGSTRVEREAKEVTEIEGGSRA